MPELIVLTAKDAIRRHMQWKMTLQLAITMREPLSADHIEQIHYFRRCAIGRWLDLPETLPIRSSHEYTQLMQAHIRFHKEMESIAELLKAGRFDDAREATLLSSAFNLASEALAAAIMACDRILTIAAPLGVGSPCASVQRQTR